MAEYRLGIDMGGTHTAIGLVSDLKVVDRVEFATDLRDGVNTYVKTLSAKLAELLQRNGLSSEEIVSIGMGVPGNVNRVTGMVEYANNLGFNNVPFQALVSDAVGSRVTLDNDANLAAYGEYLLGKSSKKSFMLITLGTGIGCGIILNGEIYRGINDAEGEIGHMTIKYDGISCNCGRRGCFEAYASSNALVKMCCDTMKMHRDCKLWNYSRIDGKAVFDALESGDRFVREVFDEYTTLLSEGLLNVINFMQPDEIAIGGGISARADLFLPEVIDKVKKQVYSRNSEKNTLIRAAAFGNDAALVGSAYIS